MAQQAQETFVAELNGTSVRVAKGEVFADKHALVKLDQAGSGTLFKPLDLGDDDEKPPPKSAAKADPPKADVKAAGGKS